MKPKQHKHWLILTIKNKKLAKKPTVKGWLNKCRNIIEQITLEAIIETMAIGSSKI